jgi:hypothetical protein
MRAYHEVRHYTAGDRVVVVDEWHPWDEEHGIRHGEIYTCLGISADGFTAIDNGTCEEGGKIVDGYYYERFDRTTA